MQYQLALTLIPSIGDVLAKKLVAYCGGVEAVFKQKKDALEKIPGIGNVLAKSIISSDPLTRAEKEIKFIEKHKVQPLFYLDTAYPSRLKHCSDSPVMLYYKGTDTLNSKRVIAVVGTRNATEYGRLQCEKLVEELKTFDVLVVSGLAYGIDICAHKACVKQEVATIGVLAHGLDRLYPEVHAATAKKMIEHGGLLTEFMSETNPDKENFPKRNRIVAGMSDATIVIESKADGGSLITADIANSYNRDVFAFPGRVGDITSEGCNNLIKTNKAALIQSAADVLHIMGWEITKVDKKQTVQKQLFIELSPDEEKLVGVLKEKHSINIDDLCFASKLSMSKVSAILLSLEFSGVVRSLPGKMYKLN